MNGNTSLSTFEKRVYRKSRSMESVVTYRRILGYFLKYVDLSAEDLADKVRDGSLDITDTLNCWLDELTARDIAPKTQRNYYHAVKKFIEVAVPKVQVSWKVVDLPKTWTVEEDRPPTKLELKSILNYGVLKDRAIVLLAISSGMREGTLADLQVKDVDFYAYKDVAVIKVSREISKGRVKCVTFTTPEAKTVLEEYLNFRRREEGSLPMDSTVFNCSKGAIRMRWIRLLKKSNKTVKKRKFFELHFHTLRKFFRTNLELAGVSKSFRERLLGHKGEYLDDAYFKPQIEALLKEYRKAIPNLTILEAVAEYEEIRKRQVLDTARLLGFGDERLKRLEEVLARSRSVDEAVEEFKRFREETEVSPRQDRVKIVQGEGELVRHVKAGWTLIKELNHDKYILKSA